MSSYALFLANSIGRHTFPVPNGSVSNSVRWVVDLFRVISGVLNKPETNLYVHCVGGVGRTGTIVACYYIYFMGMSAEDALAEMRRRFVTHGRSALMSAPETEAPVNFIKEFANTYQQWK